MTYVVSQLPQFAKNIIELIFFLCYQRLIWVRFVS